MLAPCSTGKQCAWPRAVFAPGGLLHFPPQPSPYGSFPPFSISQHMALVTLHLSPVPSFLHHYSRWPQNGTAIKTNSLDQVLHFSLSEQLGRMKGDKDDCEHHSIHPVNWAKLLSHGQDGTNMNAKLVQARHCLGSEKFSRKRQRGASVHSAHIDC